MMKESIIYLFLIILISYAQDLDEVYTNSTQDLDEVYNSTIVNEVVELTTSIQKNRTRPKADAFTNANFINHGIVINFDHSSPTNRLYNIHFLKKLNF